MARHELTADEIAAIRHDLGGVSAFGGDDSFPNPVLQGYCERVGGAYIEAILGLCYRALLARHAGHVDVKGGAAEAKNSQLAAHLREQYRIYRPALLARLPHDLPTASLGELPGAAP